MELVKYSFDRETVKLNIGGTIFICYAETLSAYPDSKLAKLDKQHDDYNLERNEYFFDRNPHLFSYILDSFRKGEVHLPKDVCGTTFGKELEFWNISQHFVSPCCLEALYHSEGDTQTMETLIDNVKEDTETVVLEQENMSIRRKIWRFLDDPKSSKLAQVWSAWMSFLVVTAVFTDALATLPTFQKEFTDQEMIAFTEVSSLFKIDNSTLEIIRTKKPQDFLAYIVLVNHTFLTLEFLLCFIVCENKKVYMKSVIRVLAFMGYMSFWIAFSIYLNLEKLASAYAMNLYFIMSYTQLLKLARLFFFTKRSPAFKIMGLTFRASIQEFKILIFLLGILVVVFGYCMFAAEYFQNSKVGNVFSAMYWALITVTTVGYGDYTPESTAGHVLAGACAVIGVLVLALPVGIIASNFYKFYNYYGYAQKHVRNLQEHNSIKHENQL